MGIFLYVPIAGVIVSLLEIEEIGVQEIMTETTLDHFWQLVFGAIALKAEAFELMQTLPCEQGSIVRCTNCWLCSASAQGIVLFLNRVKPFRFLLSLLMVPFICV